ncbi:hypothetical protein BGX38DRAFT_1276170 [Terfezia claveryi]|nr:hypothetical protein BGX38DRAFT_1276170 [Terfezia claveryi]
MADYEIGDTITYKKPTESKNSTGEIKGILKDGNYEVKPDSGGPNIIVTESQIVK